MIGKRVERLVVVSLDGPTHVICRCDCGNSVRVWKANLYRSNTRSCGCIRKTADGLYSDFKSEYESWSKMLNRCGDPSDKMWYAYGGRGIRVCDAWQSFKNFLSDMGQKPASGMTIERIDNNGHYEPSNCRWATRADQNNNTRRNRYLVIKGRKQTFTAWLRETGTNPATFYYRLKRGVPPEAALDK